MWKRFQRGLIKKGKRIYTKERHNAGRLIIKNVWKFLEFLQIVRCFGNIIIKRKSYCYYFVEMWKKDYYTENVIMISTYNIRRNKYISIPSIKHFYRQSFFDVGSLVGRCF